MTEPVSNQPVYYTKDFDNYNNSTDNYVANQELTVTITLNEYRKLIGTSATSEKKISEANSEKYEAQRESEKLQKENAELKSRIYELQNPVPDYEVNEDE